MKLKDNPACRQHIAFIIAAFLMASCTGTPTPEPPIESGDDRIVLQNNDRNDSAVIVFDGRRENGCFDDEVLRTSDEIVFNNVLSMGGCNSEIAVLSDDDRFTLARPIQPAWTNGANEVVTVELQDMYSIPVTIWIVDGDAGVRSAFQLNAQTHTARALQLYNDNNAGITFQFNEVIVDDAADVQVVQDVLQTVATTSLCSTGLGVDNTGPVRSDPGLFHSSQINIYYATFNGLNGFACGDDFIAMTAATPETLAHEIGHTLDLDHYGTTVNNNVMWRSGTQGRNNFTVGQVFRMNLNPDSGLNSLNVRSDFTRACSHTDVAETCPDITFDAMPK